MPPERWGTRTLPEEGQRGVRERNGQRYVVDGIVEVIDDARQLVLENGFVLKEFAYGSAHTLGIGKPLILVECLEADRLHKGAVQHGGRYSREGYRSVGLGVVGCFVDALGRRPIPPEPTPRHGPAGERFPVDHHAEAKDDIGGQDEYEGKVGPRHGAALAHSGQVRQAPFPRTAAARSRPGGRGCRPPGPRRGGGGVPLWGAGARAGCRPQTLNGGTTARA